MTPLTKIKMVSLPFDDVGLLPYPEPTNQSLTHTQPINQSTNHRPTNHVWTNPNATNHVSTYQSHRNQSHPNQSKSTDHISTNPCTVDQQQCMAALFCQVAPASDVGSAQDSFMVSTHLGKSSPRGRPLDAGGVLLGYDLR